MTQRLFAALMARVSRHYEPLVRERKWQLFQCLHGTVVDIGIGTGPNLPLYPSGVHVTA